MNSKGDTSQTYDHQPVQIHHIWNGAMYTQYKYH